VVSLIIRIQFFTFLSLFRPLPTHPLNPPLPVKRREIKTIHLHPLSEISRGGWGVSSLKREALLGRVKTNIGGEAIIIGNKSFEAFMSKMN
jgi:hypothetical protein